MAKDTQSVNVPNEIHRKAKEVSARIGCTLQEFISGAVRSRLDDYSDDHMVYRQADNQGKNTKVSQ